MRMRMRAAAVAACLMALWASVPATAAEKMTLDEAFRRVQQAHPNLRLVDARRDVLSAELDRAELRPSLNLGVGIENVVGTGERSGFDSAETTVTLASVFERGGKLEARRALAQSRIDGVAVEREVKRLDLLAEVARRYLAVVAVHRQRAIADLEALTQVFAAEAALSRADLERARAVQRDQSARQHLAALWGERDPQFAVASGNPYALPALDPFTQLAGWLDRTPEIAQFTGERRIREARLQLARSQATPDWNWEVGARHFRAGNDVGLLASISMPLGSRSRAQPEIRAAEAELALLEVERESTDVALYSTLAEAHGRYLSAQRAYRAGAISYLEWAQLQAERTLARKQQLDAALDAQRALIEIQRLTGQSFVDGPATNEQGEDR